MPTFMANVEVQAMKDNYGFAVEVPLEMEEAERRTRELLKAEGFGVLTEIDMRQTLKEKLGIDFRPYRILGACNPQLALRALSVEPGIGLLLPCNVVVEPGRQGHTLVRFMEPIAALGLVANDKVAAVAREASQKLHRVAQQLGAVSRDA